jgi:hypothetical protein
VLRVMRGAEAVAKRLKKTLKPSVRPFEEPKPEAGYSH